MEVPDLNKLLELDPYLTPYSDRFKERYRRFVKTKHEIHNTPYGTKAYNYFGIHVLNNNGIICREWAPNAAALFLSGEFNNWNRESHQFNNIGYGIWELSIEAKSDGSPIIQHLSELKIVIKSHDGNTFDRLSPWATYVTQPDEPKGASYQHRFWNLPKEQRYVFKHSRPARSNNLRIYECHVGIATSDYQVAGHEIGTYQRFTDEMLPRIKRQGYTAIQMMGVMEHAYYASFGYQVTSFYAVSSRYGTPEDLKRLVDRAHELDLVVLLDLVHSHASKNVLDGLNRFDGTDGCFFHDNSRGFHPQWDSRLFNLTEIPVLCFLLANIRWYMDEYKFDGFRFDGVTSMLYHSHGIGEEFGHYDTYFGLSVDEDSVVYLMLANDFLHETYPNAVTIAEDVSGMPSLCRPVSEGGIGFDYRMAMAIPDKWIQVMKTKDEDWKIADIVNTHTNRRWREPCVTYSESHDQALVGDKSIAFWLMDKEMYYGMSVSYQGEGAHIIERGIALHKIIRLFTHALGGEAYLNFIGNEFGHPEWLDFPTQANGESYHYARRQWNLVDNEELRYKYMNRWDCAVNALDEKHRWLAAEDTYVSWKHEDDKVVVFERARLVFVFNMHVNKSFPDYKIGVNESGVYRVILCSDDAEFGGKARVDASVKHFTSGHSYANRSNSIQVYIPNRCAFILAKVDETAK